MNKLFLLIPAFMVVVSASGQKQIEKSIEVKTLENTEHNKKDVTPVFKTFTSDHAPSQIYTPEKLDNDQIIQSEVNTDNSEQSILQEIYSIEDQRNAVEKNTSLSVQDRAQQINTINQNYLLKKADFEQYVVSKGVLNISTQEQNYYLSILKNDSRDQEYQDNINLINNSK